MLVLHTHWCPPRTPAETGGVLFWAEMSEGAAPTWQRGRIPVNPKPKEHPFCAPAQAVGMVFRSKNGDESAITLRLPTTRSGPLPSPGLIHNWELDQETQPFLTPWKIRGQLLPPAEALPLLVNLPELDVENMQFVLGSDALFWSRVAALVLETLAAHKLVPVIAPVDAGGKVFHARWLPVLDGPKDNFRLAQLEAAMPPVCRAAANAAEKPMRKSTSGTSESPRSLLTSFLNTNCDTLARKLGKAAAPRFSRSDNQPVHRWLDALFNDDPTVRATPSQLQAFANSHRLWMHNLHVAGDAAFRITFRLQAPVQ